METMKTISLTKGYETMVDDHLYPHLSKFKWFALENGVWGVRAARQRTIGKKKQECIMMHREIMAAKRGEIIDHIDRNPLNNQVGNLRRVTPSQSNMNRKTKHGSSRYKGVYRKRCGTGYRWAAQIRFMGKSRHIGYYKEESDAAKAYDHVALQVAGQYACLNFPEAALDCAFSLLPKDHAR